MPGDAFEFPPEMFGQVPLFAEIAKAMSWTGGPINWDMARQISTAMASAAPSPPVIDADIEELTEAVRLAESWLGEAAGFPSAGAPAVARIVTPAGWVDDALGRYRELLDPLGGKISGALAVQEPGDVEPMAALMQQMIPLFLGIQCGSVLGSLARSILSSADVPFPVEDDRSVKILAAHVDAHAREFSLDRREVRYWTALHASAHGSLYEAFPWTRAHFWSLYHAYLASIDVNLAETLERLQSMDISNPEQLQSAIGENMFGVGGSGGTGPAQERLQIFIALLEAATSRAVAAAARGRLVSLQAIDESMERRATAESAGERALERFIGTEVPEHFALAAKSFCDAVVVRAGWPALNAMWEDTERLPSANELGDPEAWLLRST